MSKAVARRSEPEQRSNARAGVLRWRGQAPWALLALAACQGSCSKDAPVAPAGSAASGTSTAPAAPVAAASPPPAPPGPTTTTAAPLERAPVLELVQRWVRLQNAADFAGYSALYAPGFTGIKRVGERETAFDRAGWLQDRRQMFQRDQRVVASGVEVLRAGSEVKVLFEQKWSSATFADRGQKLLTLIPTGSGWQIAREEMLDSRLLPAGERSGMCAQLHELSASDDASLRYFAEVTPDQQGGAMEWSQVRSPEEANERSPDGTAWEQWTLAEREGWRLAVLWASSPSGDWADESEHCFRPDGTLAQLTDSLRTFYSEHGLVSDTITRSYAPDGRVLSSTTDARYVQSGKRAEPGTYHRPEATVIMKVSELPFASLLAPAPQ